MSKLGELVLRRIAEKRISKSVVDQDFSHKDYIGWQFETSPKILEKIHGLDLAEKRVLDIGCGTGGRTAYLASLGASEVIGVDINEQEIEIAKQRIPELYSDLAGRVQFHSSSEDDSLDLGEFDIVILIDAMEHVVSPPAMMKLAHNYLKKGGEFFFTCIGYYHRHGSHMGMMPFVNVIFSDETILNVMRWMVSRPDYKPNRFDSIPPIDRWKGIYDLRDRPGEHLNKLTIKKIQMLLRYSIFRSNSYDIIGYNRKGILFGVLNAIRSWPGIRELLHSIVVVRCVK